MCQSSIDKTALLIMSVVAMAFDIPVSCVYTCIYYSCRCLLEVHRYFSVHVEVMLCLFCKYFLSRRHMASLVCKELLNKLQLSNW